MFTVAGKTDQKPAIKKLKKGQKIMNNLSIIDQLNSATQKQNRLAFGFGGLLGGLVPFFGYRAAHVDFNVNSWYSILVIAALLFSGITVVKWGKVAFGCLYKAIGFAVLLELTMVFSTTFWVSLMALGVVILINAIATGANLALDTKMTRAVARKTGQILEKNAGIKSKKVVKKIAKKTKKISK